MSTKSKKAASAVAATVLSSLLLLGGTLAWQSINQQALNEASSEVNPGGRLHDDFNGVDKRIYVENFADEPIYARIRLLEYLEVGDAAGMNLDDPGRYDAQDSVSIISAESVDPVTAQVITPTALSYSKDTWLPHNFDPVMVNHTASYFTWQTGGSTLYMPTFNMNKDSLQPDINGTLQGSNGLYPWEETDENRDDPYSDYVNYPALGAGHSLSCYEIRDADANTDDELFNNGIDVYEQIVLPSGIQQFVTAKNIKISDAKVEHTVKSTPSASLISMKDWLALYEQALEQYEGKTLLAQSSLSDYWVYDTDGWCYYSKPIHGGEATGLLLSGIIPDTAKISQDNCYYAIHVDAQFITGDDMGSEADKDGFYTDEAPTHEALTLLGIIGVDVS